mmetsp:Transcript_15222/g.21708  ORF Transcript_15222/g.21708 Transcript_15222/m.21708 type:complete len:469 (-) Transcript_15222:107-1513(-)
MASDVETSEVTITPEQFKNFSDDVKSLWVPNHVPIIDGIPDPLTFLRDYVAPSRPCIIRNAIQTTYVENNGTKVKPLRLTLNDIVDLLDTNESQDVMLTVDVTPDGHGDCVRTIDIHDNGIATENKSGNRGLSDTSTNSCHDDTMHISKSISKSKLKKMFVKPEERKMTVKEFREILRNGRSERWKHEWNEKENAKDRSKLQVQEQNSDFVDENRLQILKLDDDEVEFCEERSDQISYTLRRPVPYYSRQNDCLRNELKQLFELNLFPSSFIFAEEAFSTGPPDAINLWIGDERSVSSMHKDHYENLFYVLSGEKVFTICPPADSPFLHEAKFESGTFCTLQNNDGKFDSGIDTWSVKSDNSEDFGVRWIEPDIDNIIADGKILNDISVEQDDRYHKEKSYLKKFPNLQFAHPLKIHVSEGEMLYLPSLWYHKVTQLCETIGINYWYDMKFDSPQWSYFNFIQHLRCK